MIEAILWYLIVLDCIIYAGLTINVTWFSKNKKQKHHFWKSIPLNWVFAIYYVILVAWLGFALNRLGILF